MTIHKEGYSIIIISIIILFGINFLLNLFIVENSIIQSIVLGCSLIVLMLIIQFFRSPNRDITEVSNNIVCPADGKVVVIEEVEETEYFKDKRIQVSIFMSPLNVHVNWYPISGTVRYAKYHPGAYLVAWHPKSSTLNERTTLVIENENGIEVLTRQIAGAVARRIVYYSEEGNKAKQGEQLGFIKFGSRLDVFLPLDAKVLVGLGDKVKGCLTTLATFN
jgi:phosphatidylserine decarboxylase